ncbi:hypothetical protein N656DRAFT_584491 [Canariomyces notabilis]|uniref:Secreted protein n=1 Tax=Canariomyces notabilis TaxID=2074819 RepID=A0AAN6TH24_9PEZI|nr:hypothetical protein N656DRAFT_584491 [Canariomyces arenarius]
MAPHLTLTQAALPLFALPPTFGSHVSAIGEQQGQTFPFSIARKDRFLRPCVSVPLNVFLFPNFRHSFGFNLDCRLE